MSLNCSAKPTFNPPQIMYSFIEFDQEQINQEDMLYPWINDAPMADANGFENDIPSDALDAMADLAYEQHQAMMEEHIEPPTNNHETINVRTT
jgi:hypothetical protein